LDLGNEVPGRDLRATHSGFLASQVTSIRLDAGDGSDSIVLGPLQSNIPSPSSAHRHQLTGDRRHVGNDTLTLTAISASSTFVNITSYGGINSLLWLPGLGSADVFEPSGVLTPLRIDMASGAGALNVNTLAQFSDLTINGSSGPTPSTSHPMAASM